MDQAFVEQMKKRVEKELAVKELETVQLWKGEIEQIIRHKTESLSALQQELRTLADRMNNRIQVLKRSGL